MPAEEFNDDMVANLLAKDAKESLARYSTLGVDALLSKKSVNSTLKPNLRFLKNILEDTDSHNAALKAKVQQESRSKLDRIHRPRMHYQSPNRDLDEIHRGKRRRVDDRDYNNYDYDPRQKRHHDEDVGHYNKMRSKYRGGGHRKTISDNNHFDVMHPSRSSRHHSSRYKTSRSTSTDSQNRNPSKNRSAKRRRSREASPHHHSDTRRGSHTHYHGTLDSRSRDSSPERSYVRRGHRKYDARLSPHLSTDAKMSKPSMRSPPPRGRSSSTSKGLTNTIGLAPPPPPPLEASIIRHGRGTFAAAAIETHFAPTYDPSLDVQPDPDCIDDWDQALEAMRDRRQWIMQSKKRLKEAGFTAEEIERLEKRRERGVADVRWRKQGEGREWDKGKVVDTDGRINVVPEW